MAQTTEGHRFRRENVGFVPAFATPKATETGGRRDRQQETRPDERFALCNQIVELHPPPALPLARHTQTKAIGISVGSDVKTKIAVSRSCRVLDAGGSFTILEGAGPPTPHDQRQDHNENTYSTVALRCCLSSGVLTSLLKAA